MNNIKSELELTLKSVLIGLVIALALCGANMYLGLKIGNTISASIPASIISLGFFQFFKRHSILENNIAQTIASSGEAIATVVIYVVPALLILGTWQTIHYQEIVVFGMCGGFIGIVYSIILRKVLLADKDLKFPEGIAIGNVLIATNKSKDKSIVKTISIGILFAALINLLQNGFKLISDGYTKVFNTSSSSAGALGIGFSPAIISAGYIIGTSTFVSGATLIITWVFIIPMFMSAHGTYNAADITGSVFSTWKNYVRPIGIGVFVLGGLYTSATLLKPIKHAITSSFSAIKNINTLEDSHEDLHIKTLIAILVLCLLPIIYFIFKAVFAVSGFSWGISLLLAISVSLTVAILGFLIAAVAGYIVGLVGSSNSPLSGLYFIAVIILALAFRFIGGTNLLPNMNYLFTVVILLVSFIGFAACITNENIQDFKSGAMVGATPRKQQISLFFGVAVSVLIAPVFINLIFNAYGIGGVVPHAGIDPNNTLSAPQATTIAALTKNIMYNTQDWTSYIIGIVLGIIIVIIDRIGKSTNKFRLPTFMVALGLYLPPSIILTLLVGGLLNYMVKRKQAKIAITEGEEAATKLENKANILACGLIAGESLMGVLLAIPFVYKQSSEAFRLVSDSFTDGVPGTLIGGALVLLILHMLYKAGTKLTK